MLILVVDPGHGGACALYDAVTGITRAFAWPKLPSVKFSSLDFVVIERQQARGRGDFKLGLNYGWHLSHWGVPYDLAANTLSECSYYYLVTPQRWQRNLGVSGMDYGARKRKLRDIATRRYPDLRVTLANCDALLMLDWAFDNLL